MDLIAAIFLGIACAATGAAVVLAIDTARMVWQMRREDREDRRRAEEQRTLYASCRDELGWKVAHYADPWVDEV